MDQTTANFWRKCSSCKKPIALKSKYYVCSVSTCNGLRTGYVFCSVACFERHLPGARHKQAGAIEKFRYLQISLAVILGLVGTKMLVADLLKGYIGPRFNFVLLGVVALILTLGVVTSIVANARAPRGSDALSND